MTHLPTREIGSLLLFVPPWCTLLAERPCLHCHRSKVTDAFKVKLLSRDHSGINSKHACAESSVTNLKMCSGECVDNFLLFPRLTLSQYLKYKYLYTCTPSRTRSTLVGNDMHNFTVSARKLYLIDELLKKCYAMTSHNEAVSSSFQSSFHASELS
jgi:hypothetical protein